MHNIYDCFHSDEGNIVLVSPMEQEKVNISYKDQVFEVFTCSHKHTYIYVLKNQTYEPSIQLCIDNKKLIMNVKKYPAFPNKVIMSTMVYNEDSYIRQWIIFHKLIGVEHFIIYDNSKIDDKRSYKSMEKSSNLQRVLEDFIADGTVLLINWPYPKRMKKSGISGQTTQQCHSLWAFRTSLYIGFFDIDEYVNMQQHKSIPEFLASEPFEDIGSIALCNKFFYNPSNTPTNSFNFLKIYNCNEIILGERHKHFVIPKKVQALSVHEITLGKPMHIINEKKAYFNHYFFLNKSNRGKNKTAMEDNTIDVHTKDLF
jgi:hypothetical protein